MFTYQINMKGREKLASWMGGRASKLIIYNVSLATFAVIVYPNMSANKVEGQLLETTYL